MYCTIYRDELEDVFTKGISPKSNGYIGLFDNTLDAVFFFPPNDVGQGCILTVLADESEMTPSTTLFCGKLITIYEYRGCIAPYFIALNENDIDFI